MTVMSKPDDVAYFQPEHGYTWVTVQSHIDLASTQSRTAMNI